MRSLAFIVCCLAASVATAMPHAFRPAFRPIYRHHARPASHPAPRPVSRPVPRPAPKPVPRPAPRPVHRPVSAYHWPSPFWTGFGIGLLPAIIHHHPKPVVVGPVANAVWVPDHYEDKPVLDALGNVLRYERVFVPGHWE